MSDPVDRVLDAHSSEEVSRMLDSIRLLRESAQMLAARVEAAERLALAARVVVESAAWPVDGSDYALVHPGQLVRLGRAVSGVDGLGFTDPRR